MTLQHFTKSKNFWLYQLYPNNNLCSNIYRIGLFPDSFKTKFDFSNQHISHIYLDYRLKNCNLKRGVHFGTILYNGYNPLHLTTPFSGIITKYNRAATYNYYFGYELIDKENWLIEMEIFDYEDNNDPHIDIF